MPLQTPQKGGTELGYAEITSNATSTTLDANHLDGTGDVAGLSVTATVASRPVEVTFACSRFFNDTVTTSALVHILEDGVNVLFVRYDQTATASEGGPVFGRIRRPLAAGSHTWKVVLTTLAVGTSTISASATGPASLRVVEC